MGVVGAAVGGDGVGGDLHHGGDDVHARPPLQLELLPHGGRIGVGLALDFEGYGLCCHDPFLTATSRLTRLCQDFCESGSTSPCAFQMRRNGADAA